MSSAGFATDKLQIWPSSHRVPHCMPHTSLRRRPLTPHLPTHLHLPRTLHTSGMDPYRPNLEAAGRALREFAATRRLHALAHAQVRTLLMYCHVPPLCTACLPQLAAPPEWTDPHEYVPPCTASPPSSTCRLHTLAVRTYYMYFLCVQLSRAASLIPHLSLSDLLLPCPPYRSLLVLPLPLRPP